MSARVHPTALIDPRAQLGLNVEVGPFVIVGPDVTVGDCCVLAPRVTLERNVRLAESYCTASPRSFQCASSAIIQNFSPFASISTHP